jgi:DNA-binding NarL/FixJ family response regulator
MAGSIHKAAVVIDAMDFRRAGVESFLAAWAKHEDVDLISIPLDQIHEKLSGDIDCRILIYNAGGAHCSSPEVVAEIHELRALRPDAALVIVTDDNSLEGVCAAISAGAQGYFDNAMQPALALLALSFVLRGGTYFPPTAILKGRATTVFPYRSRGSGNGEHEDPAYSVDRSDDDNDDDHVAFTRVSTLTGKQDAGARPAQFQMTARQEAVISCLCVGDSNKAIARKLGLTETAVKVHVREVMRKLGVCNRTQVAIISARNAVVPRSVADRPREDASDELFPQPLSTGRRILRFS